MLSNVLSLLGVIFQSAWTLLTCFYIPGTNVTPAGLLIFSASAIIGIHFIKQIFSSFNGGKDE